MSSILKVDQLQDSGGNAILTSDGAGNITTPGITTGKVLQVVSTLKTDKFSTTSTSETDITGLSVNITPSSTSSKILIMSHITVSSNQISGNHFRVLRGTTPVGVGSDGSRTPMGFVSDGGVADSNRAITTGAYTFIDEPSSTSQLTYKVTVTQFNGSNTVRVNTNGTLGGQTYDDIFTSGITAMEIAG
jgi:hypothetical protein